MAEQIGYADLSPFCQRVVGKFPAGQVRIYICVEVQFFFLCEFEESDAVERFADGGRLEKGLSGDGDLFTEIGPSVTFSPEDLVVLYNGDAQAVDMVIDHTVFYVCGMLAGGLDGADEIVLNLDYFVIVVCWFLCAAGKENIAEDKRKGDYFHISRLFCKLYMDHNDTIFTQ